MRVEGWLEIAEANEAARRGNPLLIAKSDAERREFSMEQRFGGLARLIHDCRAGQLEHFRSG
ncbi:hypothetical protein [Bradyrhizobium sp. JR3.5]